MENFKDEHREFFVKFMQWYWAEHLNPNRVVKDVTISDYEFIYTLWKNSVPYYDKKMKERLNKLREIYLNNKN